MEILAFAMMYEYCILVFVNDSNESLIFRENDQNYISLKFTGNYDSGHYDVLVIPSNNIDDSRNKKGTKRKKSESELDSGNTNKRRIGRPNSELSKKER